MRRQTGAEIVEDRFQIVWISAGVIVSADQVGCKFVEQVICFVGNAWAADYTDRVATVLIDHRIKLLRHVTNRLVPGCGDKLSALFVTNQRCAYALFVIY